MERYESLGPLGEGSYGTVVKCRHRDSGRLVAIKKFLDSDDDRTVKKIALREIKLLRQLRHDNLVNLLEVWKRRRRWYLVFEFVDRTLLDDLEQNPSGLDLNTSRRYLYQILRAAAFCHQQNIIHRDIKPENVLISLGGVVKLCDFGFARTVASPTEGGAYTDYVATRWYRAPELLVGDTQYGKPVDVWAIGCLLIETLTGQPLFPGDSDLDQIHHIVRCFGNLTPHHQELFHRNPVFSGVRLPESSGRVSLQQRFRTMFPAALDLAQSCLEVDPEKRAQCAELLEHPFFTQDSFHIRFVEELNAKIQKGHRENSTLPKITKTLRQERDGGVDRKCRTRDKKHTEDFNQKVNKDRTKGKPDTKTSRAEPQAKQSRSVPGQVNMTCKNRQGKVKPLTSDPSEQTHEELEDCPKARKDVELIIEPSRSSQLKQIPESGKNWDHTEVPKHSSDHPSESACRHTSQISHVDPVQETKTTLECQTRAETRQTSSLEVKPSNPKLTKTAGPNQTCVAMSEVPPFDVPGQSDTEPPFRLADPNTSRSDQISKRLPRKKDLTQDLGDNRVPAASGEDHQEDLKPKVATQVQSRSPSSSERTVHLRTLVLLDKENHTNSTTTKSKSLVGPTSGSLKDEKTSNRCDVQLVMKSLKEPNTKGLVKPDFKPTASSKTLKVAHTNMAVVVSLTSVRSTQDQESSPQTSVHNDLNTADLQDEGLNPPPPPASTPNLPPPPPHDSDPICSAADSCPTPAAGFHPGTPGIRCVEKFTRHHGAVSTRQNQQLVSVHVGRQFCDCSFLSDRCNLSVGGSGVTLEKNKTHIHFPDLRRSVVSEPRSREGKRNKFSTKDQRKSKHPLPSNPEPQQLGPHSTGTETQTD
ncbi:cyclin-dependent kinase-like 3 [Salarias fasciatus]|uniref:Cyclin-dependent kinase-like 2 n=1 Tax=Salarias fasciatus TaxID=181472 RepID=A0A672HIT2_SALFA|nr:cyclin-dependent kinase-like 3 [Salarias fasciatus]